MTHMNFHALLFLSETLGPVLLMTAVAFLAGKRVTQAFHVTFANLAEEIALCTAAGFGIVSCVVLLLGLAGLLKPPWLIAAFLLLALLSAPVALQTLRRIRNSGAIRWRNALLWSLSVLLFLPLWLLPLYPPTAPDATTYHLAVAKYYATTGSVTPTPQFRYAVFPQTAEMLFTAGLLLGTDSCAQVFSLLFLLVTVVAVGGYLRHISGMTASLIGAGLLVSNSVVVTLGVVAYADMALTTFVTLSLLSFLRWLETRERGWLIAAGGMAGFAAGTKYSALFFFVPLIATSIVISIRRRSARVIAPLVLSSLVAGAPWYVYNWLSTGNPIWPFFPDVFGLAYWNAADLQEQLTDLMRTHGNGTDILALLTLPWNVFFRADFFHSVGTLSVSLAASIPFALYACLRSASMRWTGAVLFAYGLFWFFTAQILRYLVPVVPLLCVLSAGGIMLIFRRTGREPFGDLPLAGFVFALLLVLPGWFYAIKEASAAGPLPLSSAGRDAYLARRLPSYRAVCYANATGGPGSILYSYHDPQMAYFADGEFRGDVFGPWRYSRFERMINGPESLLLSELHEIDARYLLIRDDAAGSGSMHEWFSWTRIVPVYRTPGVILFRVLSSPLAPHFGPELTPADNLTLPDITRDGVHAPVSPDSLYSCTVEGNADPGPVTVVVRLEWISAAGRPLRADETTGVFLRGGGTVSILATSPGESTSALITCTSLGGGIYSVRSLSLRHLYYSPSHAVENDNRPGSHVAEGVR